MNLSEQQLEEVYKNAELFLSPEEIAVLLDLDVKWVIREVSSKKGPLYLNYMRGKTASKKAIRENVVKMARHGSPQAEELAEKYMAEQKIAEKNARR
jgi:hypothetical protein